MFLSGQIKTALLGGLWLSDMNVHLLHSLPVLPMAPRIIHGHGVRVAVSMIPARQIIEVEQQVNVAMRFSLVSNSSNDSPLLQAFNVTHGAPPVPSICAVRRCTQTRRNPRPSGIE